MEHGEGGRSDIVHCERGCINRHGNQVSEIITIVHLGFEPPSHVLLIRDEIDECIQRVVMEYTADGTPIVQCR